MSEALYDFYKSEKARQRHRELCDITDEVFCLPKFKGIAYDECINHGKTPILPDDDLELIGTGKHSDINIFK